MTRARPQRPTIRPRQSDVRVLQLWRRLEGQRTRPRLHVLAAEFGVTVRTICRDLRTLDAAHYVVPPPAYAEERAS